MEPKFKEMVEEHPEVHITLDREDPNASRSEIVLKSTRKNKTLVRKGDVTDGLIGVNYKDEHQIETDTNESPFSHHKNFDFDNLVTNKSDKMINDSPKSSIGMTQSESTNALPMVNYFVPLLMSPNSILDIFEQT